MSMMELKARIDEENCIGCSKCLRVCPTDAIVGSKKMLHTIIPQWCTSCSRCIEVCPTNCIELATPGSVISIEEENRLIAEKAQRQTQANKPTVNPIVQVFKPMTMSSVPAQSPSHDQRKQSVADAIARAKAKRALMQNKPS